MAESADATDSKSVFSNEVRVQVPFPALSKKTGTAWQCLFIIIQLIPGTHAGVPPADCPKGNLLWAESDGL